MALGRTAQRREDNGISSRRWLGGNLWQVVLVGLVTGSFSLGGMQFVSKDSVKLDKRVSRVEQTLSSHIEKTKELEELRDENVKQKIDSIEKEVSAIREDQKNIKHVLQEILLRLPN